MRGALRGTLLCLLALILLGASLGAFGTVSAAAETPAPHALDFSNPASEATVEIAPSELLALLEGCTPGDLPAVEVDYLDRMLLDAPLRYSDAIPGSLVETAYNRNTLTVTARPHRYTAENGVTVTWSPVALLLDGTEHPLTDDGEIHSVTVENVPESEGRVLEVRYISRLSLSAEQADGYRGYTYGAALHLAEARDQNLAAIAEYEAHVTAYEQYREAHKAYLLQSAAYETYLVELGRFERADAAYQAYLADRAAYETALGKYHDYEAALAQYESDRVAYLAAVEQYDADLRAYEAAFAYYQTFAAELSVIKEKLATLDSAFVHNSQGKQMYATLMGDTVATVVENRKELEAYAKCEPAHIDTANGSTALLQRLLTEYKSLTTLRERYAFYTEHYVELRDNFIALQGALEALFKNSTVQAILIQKDRYERYIEFLSQLYVIATGLEDEGNRSTAWGVRGKNFNTTTGEYDFYTYTDMLEPAQIPPDLNNSDPRSHPFPAGAPDEPIPPAVPVPPTKPTPVTEPSPPDVVAAPGQAPAVVEQPVEPTPVSEPGKRPAALVHTDTQKALLAAYDEGILIARPVAPATLTLETTLSRRLTLQNKSIIEFYDADGKTLLYATELDRGEAITYPHAAPTRAETEKHIYTFAGWKTESGELLTDLGVVDAAVESFYASYTATVKRYTVTWLTGDETVTSSVEYGAVPTHPSGAPTRTDGKDPPQYTYDFLGWQLSGEEGWTTELPPVRGDVTYEAIFDATLCRYTVEWLLWEGHSIREVYDYGVTPTPPTELSRPEDDRFLYEFTGWSVDPSPVVGDTTYTALYRARPIVTTGDGQSAPPPVLDDAKTTYTATMDDKSLAVTELLALAERYDRAIVLAYPTGGLELQFTAAFIAELRAAGCATVSIVPTTRATDNLRWAILFADAEGNALAPQNPFTLRRTGATAYTRAYAIAADGTARPLPATLAEGILQVKLSGEHISASAVVLLRDEFPIELGQCKEAILTADHEVAEAGTLVHLTVSHSDGWDRTALRIVGSESGNEYALLAGDTFYMPHEPVLITVELSQRSFTVTFTVDGVEIDRRTYHKGELIVLPPAPVKPGEITEEGEVVYTFTGWSPAVNAETVVTGDATYTATFQRSVNRGADAYTPPHAADRSYLLLTELASVLLLIPTAIAGLRRLRRRKRRSA